MSIIPLRKPRTYTSPEALIEEVRQGIFGDGSGYKKLAEKVGVSPSTIGSLANGKTRWPRPTTLFPLLNALDMELRLVRKGGPR